MTVHSSMGIGNNPSLEVRIMEKLARKKVLLYYNPYSGNGIFRNNLDHIIERIQDAGFQAVPVRMNHGIVIEKVFATMNQEEFSRIICCGGDGTINICVNAMVRNDIHLPIGILPSGTANDFAYYYELPSDIDMALDVALGSKTTQADVGRANGRCFINVCALGAMVDVSQKTDPRVKHAIGSLAYYITAVSELPQIHPIKVRLTTKESVHDEEIYFMTVLNGESAGGFRKLSPDASMKDGKLDIIVFKKMPIVDFAPLLHQVIIGTHPENKNVLYFQTDYLKIESDEDIATDFDGEAGEKLPIEFSLEKLRLEVFVSERTWHYDD